MKVIGAVLVLFPADDVLLEVSLALQYLEALFFACVALRPCEEEAFACEAERFAWLRVGCDDLGLR